MSGFVHTERVRFGDLDAMRHLNNVVFLRYFESARIAYMRHLNPSHDPVNPEGEQFGAILASAHMDYRSPATFDEQVAIECRIGRVGGSSFQMTCRMTVEDRLVAEGHCVLVAYDYATGTTMQLPDELRERLTAEVEE